jgi:glycosyltransferase involved in cell wall biosynthesis
MEISLFGHWGLQPNGIPRLSQNIFLQSLGKEGVRHFYFHRTEKRFIVPNDTAYFCDLAAGRLAYKTEDLPAGEWLEELLKPEDRVLITEAGWDHPGHLDAVKSLRSQFRSNIFQYLLCDLIPVKFPHFFEQDFGSRAADYMRALPSFCDRYACISHSTASDVRAILSQEAEIHSFIMGSNVVEGDAASICQSSASKPYVLCVGTVEIRKNHILLYFVWRRLALLLGKRCPKLVLVGRQGWISGDVYTLLTTDPVVKDFVEIRHDVPNEELVGLIKGCEFTVFPSFYEGWGLPASESLFYGKLCATSNTSSLPEINPFCDLMFDPYDHNAAFELIRSLIESPDLIKQYEAQIPDNFKRQTWEESFEELHKIIEA